MESFAMRVSGKVTTIYEMTFKKSDDAKMQDVMTTLPAVPFLASVQGGPGQPVVDLAMNGEITFDHAQWLMAAAKFCFHFYPKESAEYVDLCKKFASDRGGQLLLDKIYLKSMGALITEYKIYEVLAQNHQFT